MISGILKIVFCFAIAIMLYVAVEYFKDLQGGYNMLSGILNIAFCFAIALMLYAAVELLIDIFKK